MAGACFLLGYNLYPPFDDKMTIYTEDDLLPLSALQHLLFCERQCALIHIEQMWSENRFFRVFSG